MVDNTGCSPNAGIANSLAQSLCSIVFVESIMGDLPEVILVCVEEGISEGDEVTVLGVINVNLAPGILPSSDCVIAYSNGFVGADDCKGHQGSEGLALLGDATIVAVKWHTIIVAIVVTDIVREVVNTNTVSCDILHYRLLVPGKLVLGERVCFADDGDDIDTMGQSGHECDIDFAETVNKGKGGEESVIWTLCMVFRIIATKKLTRDRWG